MRFPIKYMIGCLVFTPFVAAAAQQWSNCVAISGVANYMAFNNDNLIILNTSPNVACTFNGVAGAIGIGVGTQGVTASNIGMFFAQALAAQASGRTVQVFYDSTTCYGAIIATGGYTGDCP